MPHHRPWGQVMWHMPHLPYMGVIWDVAYATPHMPPRSVMWHMPHYIWPTIQQLWHMPHLSNKGPSGMWHMPRHRPRGIMVWHMPRPSSSTGVAYATSLTVGACIVWHMPRPSSSTGVAYATLDKNVWHMPQIWQMWHIPQNRSVKHFCIPHSPQGQCLS